MKALAFPLLLALGGCASMGGALIYKKNVDDYYSIGEASVFAAAGGPTIVYGAPANGARPSAVAESMRLPRYLSPQSLTAVEDAGDGLRLVLVFAPAIAATSEQVCAGEAKGGVSGPRTKIFAVYCTGRARPITEAIIEFEGAPLPGDPRFDSGMEGLLQVLFPPYSPRDRERDCILPGC